MLEFFAPLRVVFSMNTVIISRIISSRPSNRTSHSGLTLPCWQSCRNFA